ncbi:MAG: hypothetical protein PHN53_05125, partial [Eubacteriales bacterium]|nr:hypothetical protein [Eubacteriales bacterium]
PSWTTWASRNTSAITLKRMQPRSRTIDQKIRHQNDDRTNGQPQGCPFSVPPGICRTQVMLHLETLIRHFLYVLAADLPKT